MRNACAITLAVVTPTRKPVKRPGPVPTAIAARWSRDTPHSPRRYWMAGASCSAWRRPPASCTDPSTAPRSPNATDTCAVDVSSASNSTSAGPGVDARGGQRSCHRVAPVAPADAEGIDRHDAVVVALTRLEQHAEPVARQRRTDAIAPLDDGHRVLADEVVESEVVQLLHVIEAIDVDVHERCRRVVLAHHGERRAHHRFGDAEPDRDALGQHGLADPELAVEHDDVTGAQERAEALTERVRLQRIVGRGPQRRHDDADARASARLTVTKSARAWASAAPPLRSTAEGWNTGMSTAPSRNGNSRPRSLVMPSLVSSSSLVAKLPRVTTTFGSMKPICASR